MKILLSLLLSIIILAPCEAQKLKPVLNLVKGNTYYTASTVTSSIVQNYNGQDITIAVDMTAKTAYNITDVKDSIYTMQVSYSNIAMKIVSPNGTVDMNSDKKDNADVPSRFLSAMINKPFSVTITRSGRVLEVKNIEAIINSVFTSMPQMDEAKKAQMKAQFMQSFGENAFKGNLEQTLAIYPSVKVSKGANWVINTTLQSVMAANITTTYQLQDVTDTYYQIHGDAKITTANDGKVSQINGMPVKYNLSGTLTSDIKADKKTGWVIEEKLKQDVSGTIDIQDNPQIPGGMKVPMKIHSDITTTDH
ncbi:MAG: DUF6263 family protein [Sphingobacteriales bacterium]